MNEKKPLDISYFPGCSLATSARESDISLRKSARRLGLNLIELEDWNCCGSSSAHSVDPDLAFQLAARNLSLVPKGNPLMAMCPSCFHRLSIANHHLKAHPEEYESVERRWGNPVDPKLRVFHFFDILETVGIKNISDIKIQDLDGLRFVPYYGCMLNAPASMKDEKKHYGLIEKFMKALGAEPVYWPHSNRCCGTFLAAARPDIATPLVNDILEGAAASKTECIVTACAMCQLNLEIRSTIPSNIPILHFTEILAIALGERECKGWFSRHIVDPLPLLRSKNLVN